MATDRPIHLSRNWTVTKVEDALEQDDKNRLFQFLTERYRERFFAPIKLLIDESKHRKPSGDWRFGFSIMALCCLLIETIQCYREGLPTTSGHELRTCRVIRDLHPECELPSNRVTGEGAFARFFQDHQKDFPDVDGVEFYSSVRCGLLHQAQTKNGWAFSGSGVLCNPHTRTINRTKFAEALEDCFGRYISSLSTDGDAWKRARRKIRWLCRLSTARP